MKHSLISLLCGTLFGIGLSISQMINPNKVINFLDITGNWDPSLAFVMLGALIVSFLGFKWILKRPTSLYGNSFHISKRTELDKALIGGSTVFGIGWGMSGYCPGPAVANIGLGSIDAIIIVLSIYAGFFCQKWFSQD